MSGIRAKLNGSYKSLKGPLDIDLPQFTVLTGRNGVGKSQLLQLLFHGLREPAPRQRPEVVLEVDSLYKRGEVVLEDGRWPLSNSGTEAGQVRSLAYNTWHRYKNPAGHSRDSEDHYFDELRIQRLRNTLGVSDALEAPEQLPTGFYLSNRFDLGRLSEELCFTFYHHMIRTLETCGDLGEAYERLIARTKPPWEALTELINDAGIQLRCVPPIPRVMSAYQLHFESEAGDKVQPLDLSSGERTVIGLAAWLLLAGTFSLLPKVVLLDEADAHLHSSMIPQFVRAVEHLLVKRYGCTVVMATHRTETLLSVDHSAIHEMHKSVPRLRRSETRASSMSLLTDGYFHVARPRRCVFVEGEPDARFYSLTDRMIPRSPSDGDLFFVPISIESGNRSEGGGRPKTEGWVPRLSRAGLDDVVVGLVDFDREQPSTPGIFCIPRYSIENYLVDPLVVYAYMMNKRAAPSVPGVALHFGQECVLKTLPEQTLQAVVNCMLELFRPLRGWNDTRVPMRFEGGITLDYPLWLLTEPGKVILAALREQLPQKLRDGMGPVTLSDAFERVHMLPHDLSAVLDAIRQGGQQPLPPWRA